MSDWFYELPVVWMAVVVFTVTYLATAAIWWSVMSLASRNRAARYQRVAAGLLSPLGITFGLLVGFLSVQVWNDSQRAREAVIREAGALRTAVILASSLPAPARTQIDALIARHIQYSTNVEWPAMADRRATIATVPAALGEAMRLTLAAAPATEQEMACQRELLRSLEDALEGRRQRIIISQVSINWVKWSTLAIQAALLLITIGMIHCEHGDTAAIAMGIFATAVAASALLIASHTRPFTGQISVSANLLREVMPSTGSTATRP